MWPARGLIRIVLLADHHEGRRYYFNWQQTRKVTRPSPGHLGPQGNNTRKRQMFVMIVVQPGPMSIDWLLVCRWPACACKSLAAAAAFGLGLSPERRPNNQTDASRALGLHSFRPAVWSCFSLAQLSRLCGGTHKIYCQVSMPNVALERLRVAMIWPSRASGHLLCPPFRFWPFRA